MLYVDYTFIGYNIQASFLFIPWLVAVALCLFLSISIFRYFYIIDLRFVYELFTYMG